MKAPLNATLWIQHSMFRAEAIALSTLAKIESIFHHSQRKSALGISILLHHLIILFVLLCKNPPCEVFYRFTVMPGNLVRD